MDPPSSTAPEPPDEAYNVFPLRQPGTFSEHTGYVIRNPERLKAEVVQSVEVVKVIPELSIVPSCTTDQGEIEMNTTATQTAVTRKPRPRKSKEPPKNWWKQLSIWYRIPILILVGMAATTILSSISIWNNDRLSAADEARNIRTAQAKLEVIQTEVAGAKLKSSVADVQVPEIIPMTEAQTIEADVFSCQTKEIMASNFASHGPNEIQPGKFLRFTGPSCSWLQAGYKVTSLRGQKYIIVDASNDFDYRGTTRGRNDSESECINFINTHSERRFRIVVEDGSLKLGGGV